MQIDISVVVPTLNEELTIGPFITWCNEGFRNANLTGEIIILDSSTDSTPEIGLSMGAKIVKVEKLGLGSAYSDGKPYIQGKWVVLGDADCTYDFRDLSPFINKLNEGFDFIVGNRFSGSIEKNAMPALHQYFGSPITSWIFKYGLGIPTGDIHCGMRAMSKELYLALPFLEKSWEYATEMIVSARNLDARITEVPINFLKEPDGRVSHHKRGSWLSPFKAGWGTLRVTATYMFDRFFVVPGLILLLIAGVLNLSIFLFPSLFLQRFHAGILAQSLVTFASTVGAFAFTVGTLARFAYNRKLRSLDYFSKKKNANRLFTILTFVTLAELAIGAAIAYQWISQLGKNVTQIHFNTGLTSFWLSSVSIYLPLLSFGIVSLIGNHSHNTR